LKFNKQILKDLLLDECDESFKLIEDKITSNGRWSIHHTMIFEHNGKFYQTRYSVGATEYQDERPFQDSPDEVECDEVVPVEKTIIVYKKVTV
jgi:hypothetical protein